MNHKYFDKKSLGTRKVFARFVWAPSGWPKNSFHIFIRDSGSEFIIGKPHVASDFGQKLLNFDERQLRWFVFVSLSRNLFRPQPGLHSANILIAYNNFSTTKKQSQSSFVGGQLLITEMDCNSFVLIMMSVSESEFRAFPATFSKELRRQSS